MRKTQIPSHSEFFRLRESTLPIEFERCSIVLIYAIKLSYDHRENIDICFD